MPSVPGAKTADRYTVAPAGTERVLKCAGGRQTCFLLQAGSEPDGGGEVGLRIRGGGGWREVGGGELRVEAAAGGGRGETVDGGELGSGTEGGGLWRESAAAGGSIGVSSAGGGLLTPRTAPAGGLAGTEVDGGDDRILGDGGDWLSPLSEGGLLLVLFALLLPGGVLLEGLGGFPGLRQPYPIHGFTSGGLAAGILGFRQP